MASETRGDVTIDSGVITHRGERVGYVGQAYKHGYHPAVRLTFDVNPQDETWWEQDEKGLLDLIFAEVERRLT